MERKNLAIAFIFVTVLIDVIGLGIIIPVLPGLLLELTGAELYDAAQFGGALMFTYALMQFIFAPVLGNLSDSYGRRPVLLASLVALSIDYVIMGFAGTVFWLFVGRMLSGIAGATFATANAYIADISDAQERTRNFGLVGAAFGVGFVIGPAIGGLLADFGTRVPFFAAAALAFANAVFGYFVLPETLPKEKRRPFEMARANPMGAVLQMRRYPIIMGLLVVIVLYQLAHDANPATWSFYMIEKFGWSERDIGLSLAAVGLSMAIVQGALIGPIIDRIGERRTAYAGLLMGGIGFIGFATAAQGWMIYAWIIPFSFIGIAMPAIKGIMSRQVSDDAQGELQGAISSLMAAVWIFSPLLMTQLFSYFSGPAAPIYFPGASFLAAGVLMLLALMFSRNALQRIG